MHEIMTIEELRGATKLRDVYAHDVSLCPPGAKRSVLWQRENELATFWIHGSRFADVSFARCRSSRIDVRKSTFDRVRFDSAHLEFFDEGQSVFRECSYVGTRFDTSGLGVRGSRYERCQFVRSRFHDTPFLRGEFLGCLFEDCRFTGNSGGLFHDSVFERCAFRGMLKQATFGTPVYEWLDLREKLDYRRGRLRPNTMLDVDFSQATLWGVRFLYGVDLTTVVLPQDGRHLYVENWPDRAERLIRRARAEGGIIAEQTESFLGTLGSWHPEDRPDGGISRRQQQYILNPDWILEEAGETAGRFILDEIGGVTRAL